jgi:hypothetical protein
MGVGTKGVDGKTQLCHPTGNSMFLTGMLMDDFVDVFDG